MELTLNGATVAIISLGVVILLAVVGGHMTLVFRVSKLPTREELNEVHNEARQDSIAIRAEMAAMRDEFRRDMEQMREDFRRDMAAMRDELRQEFRQEMAELREGMRQEFRQEMATMRAEMRLEFRQDMEQMRQEFRQDMAEMRRDMEQMREDFRRDMAEMREDLLAAIRASEARIIKAIMDHRHPTPDAPPVFIEPV